MNRPQKKLNLWYDSFPKMLYWWTLLFRAIRDTKLTSITFLLISMLFTLVFTSELLLKNFICSDTPCNQRTPSFVMIRKSFYIESNACSWCDVNFVNMICFVTMMLNISNSSWCLQLLHQNFSWSSWFCTLSFQLWSDWGSLCCRHREMCRLLCFSPQH
jgi:hypothetical protein